MFVSVAAFFCCQYGLIVYFFPLKSATECFPPCRPTTTGVTRWGWAASCSFAGLFCWQSSCTSPSNQHVWSPRGFTGKKMCTTGPSNISIFHSEFSWNSPKEKWSNNTTFDPVKCDGVFHLDCVCGILRMLWSCVIVHKWVCNKIDINSFFQQKCQTFLSSGFETVCSCCVFCLIIFKLSVRDDKTHSFFFIF